MTISQRIALVAITRPGAITAQRLLSQLPSSHLYMPAKLTPNRPGSSQPVSSAPPTSHIPFSASQIVPFTEPLSEKLGQLFQTYDGLVLFMALGAAFRLLAPYLRDKKTDPAVVVVDDLGKFAISALSGHQGGANALARQVADILGGQAVITTASDVAGTLRLDLLGRQWGWLIEGEENLTRASAALVNGEPVAIFQEAGEGEWWSQENISSEPGLYPLPENIKLVASLEEMLQGNFTDCIIISDRLLPPEMASLAKKAVIYRPKSLVLGIGCKRGTPVEEIESLVQQVLQQQNLSHHCIRNLASIDIKRDEPGLLQFAQKLGVPVSFFSQPELNTIKGVSRVCEPAALLSAGAREYDQSINSSLLVRKQKTRTVTVAVARVVTKGKQSARGKLYVVGLGPGDPQHLTARAQAALRESHVIVGYRAYLELISEIVAGKEIIASGMREEVTRVEQALDVAKQGKVVALVSSGDAGIYGMAGLAWEMMRERGWVVGREIDLDIVPGVPALNAAASLLGAPLAQDFAAISLSDLLIPWETIARRLEAAAQGDLVIVLYNPKSQQRTHQIGEAQRLLLRYRSPNTPVGVVTNAYRQGQRVIIADLAHFVEQEIDMLTIIIVGNSQTFVYGDRMVTRRGYLVKRETNAAKPNLSLGDSHHL